MIKVFAGVSLSMFIRLLCPCFTMGQASYPCHHLLLFFFHKIWIIKVI